MSEPRRNAIIVQREITATRTSLVSHVERLRGALRRRLSLRSQMQAHPGLVAVIALALSLPIVVLALATRAVFTRRRTRARRLQRWVPRR